MIDQDLQNAYEKATYQIVDPPISWLIGDTVPRLDALFIEHSVRTGCFVTAHNPYSILTPVEENQSNQERLFQLIQVKGWPYYAGWGLDPAGVWPPEASFLVLGLSEKESKLIGRQFRQNAVVFLEIGAPAQLLPCRD